MELRRRFSRNVPEREKISQVGDAAVGRVFFFSALALLE